MLADVAQQDRSKRIGRSLIADLAACVLLIVQFLVGMVVNLWVTVPTHHPGAGAHNFFAGAASATAWVIPHGPPWLALHAALGLALVVAAFASIAWAPAMGSRLYTAAAVLAALTILGAGFNGASFVNYGHDFSSMIMSGLWALSLACYLACLYMAARRPARATTAAKGAR